MMASGSFSRCRLRIRTAEGTLRGEAVALPLEPSGNGGKVASLRAAISPPPGRPDPPLVLVQRQDDPDALAAAIDHVPIGVTPAHRSPQREEDSTRTNSREARRPATLATLILTALAEQLAR